MPAGGPQCQSLAMAACKSHYTTSNHCFQARVCVIRVPVSCATGMTTSSCGSESAESEDSDSSDSPAEVFSSPPQATWRRGISTLVIRRMYSSSLKKPGTTGLAHKLGTIHRGAYFTPETDVPGRAVAPNIPPDFSCGGKSAKNGCCSKGR